MEIAGLDPDHRVLPVALDVGALERERVYRDSCSTRVLRPGMKPDPPDR